jgi:replication factor A1
VRSKVSIDEYLAFLSIKYEVDPDNLVNALISADENKESTCGNLLINCRSKQSDKIIFLITTGPKVVGQFSMSEKLLMEQNSPLRNLAKTNALQRHLTKRNKGPHSVRIGDLRTGMRQVTLKAKVLEIATPTQVFTRFGNYASVANAVIGDDTGTVKLCLWNEQIGSVSIGDMIELQSAHVSTFRGEQQLRIGKNGLINVLESIC